MGHQGPVAVFSTCLGDAFAPEVCAKTLALVRGTGADPTLIRFGCCGQPAWNAGQPEEARRMARALIRRLRPFALIVVPSGSCAATMISTYHHFFPAGSTDAKAAEEVAQRTVELSAFLEPYLDHIPWRPERPSPVALHVSCHALRVAGCGPTSRHCLEAAGCPLASFERSEECCGFGGVFSVDQESLSAAIADRKLDALAAAGTTTVVSGEMGCLLHLEGRAERRAMPLVFRHIAEIVADRWLPEEGDATQDGGTPGGAGTRAAGHPR